MELGKFSISLTVKDLDVSIAFYEKLGFEKTAGHGGYAIMKNGDHAVIGLFQGMFEKNILTFNPGFAADATMAESFTDVRELKAKMVAAGIEVRDDTTDKNEKGPASFVMIDPDGNPILIDQHV